MNELAPSKPIPVYVPKNKLRFLTATALFDGHDASINIMRRVLQSSGVEVVHLGHNRSGAEVVRAAIQEDVQGIAITSYQGGHLEYFKYLIDLLRENNRGEIKVFGGGGGVIVPEEINELHEYGVERIYSPADGAAMGLQGMINDVLSRSDFSTIKGLACTEKAVQERIQSGVWSELARVITALENDAIGDAAAAKLVKAASTCSVPVVGITGTGGAGKSTLTDELVRRFRLNQHDELSIAIISIDPSRRKTSGALLGDRIRMNAIDAPKVFMRSLATRSSGTELSQALPAVIAACKLAKFDLVIVETSGIGQGDAAIVEFVDLPIYVMTPEFGAASQLEKIEMLDFAEIVVVNKFDRKGGEDAVRDVRKQFQRNRSLFNKGVATMPVFGTIASRFNDQGVTTVYEAVLSHLTKKGFKFAAQPEAKAAEPAQAPSSIVPPSRYLADIAESVRSYHALIETETKIARERQALRVANEIFREAKKDTSAFDEVARKKDREQSAEALGLLSEWPALVESYGKEELIVKIRDREIRTQLRTTSISGIDVPKVALPKFKDDGEILRYLMKENVPGAFPYTAGVFSFKREDEEPTRMFAGEGGPGRTNMRFKKLSEGLPAHRLSTAFDSVTLYGCDPDERPDIYGKIGNSGVSIATLDDIKELYNGFDLSSPNTSVSMTINGPAPILLAQFFNAAIDQQLEKFEHEKGRAPSDAEADKIKAQTITAVRGTVQADILKEDQGQNTCIFSTEFALKMMGDIQEYFVQNRVRNFYSVSISGYHIAEAGANPISQLAFTLANGFTFVEAYLARGLHIDDFAPNLSFFFSNGMDPEYSVIGRVARRIWAVAMRDKYGANERSQKLKYHIQTSGRSLHAQEMDFNDIRTTLQALIAINDNCNSLHTNAYDEAVTTPTEESVRRAMAIQLIINREWGLSRNENQNQGSFILDELTDLVEEAVLREFEAINARGGVLGAMETGYQRSRIQEQSLYYESKKHDGSLPIIGVNTFRSSTPDAAAGPMELARSSDEEKRAQLNRVKAFQKRHAVQAAEALDQLKSVALANGNIFAELMTTVRHCSLGQISAALYEVGGQYRRNM